MFTIDQLVQDSLVVIGQFHDDFTVISWEIIYRWESY
jgi:hypothetical protein